MYRIKVTSPYIKFNNDLHNKILYPHSWNASILSLSKARHTYHTILITYANHNIVENNNKDIIHDKKSNAPLFPYQVRIFLQVFPIKLCINIVGVFEVNITFKFVLVVISVRTTMAFTKVCLLVFLASVVCGSPAPPPSLWKDSFLGGSIEEMRSLCAEDDPIACLKYKAITFLDSILKKDNYQVLYWSFC